MTSLVFSLSFLVLIVAVLISLFLVYIVYASDPKSATNRIFSLLGIFLSLWLGVTYLGPNPAFSLFGLLFARLTLFFVTPVNTLFFLLAGTFPDTEFRMSKKIYLTLLGLTGLVMLITLSPYGFSGASVINGAQVVSIGIGFPIFGAFSILLNLGAIYWFIRKLRRSSGEEYRQIRLVVSGLAIMLGLIILTIFFPVFILKNTLFVPFAPLYVLIFLGTTTYAIVKHRLFNLKVIATDALTVVLIISLLSKTVIDQGLSQRLVDLVIFIVALVFGVLLIRSVRQEVKQREELQRLNEKIEATNKQLETLSRFKSELLSLASHQIRAPLGAIKGFVSLIMEGSYGAIDPKVKEPLDKVKASADELISLINTFLDVRKVEDGKMEYQFAKTDLGKIVGEVVELMRPVAQKKALTLTFVPPAKPVFVNADLEKLKQVFQNLVDNSIKYTPSGFVKVALEEKDGSATFVITDSGLGIPSTLIPYLFEEFIRDERVKKNIRGTGLGLYIAKQIVIAHSGKIWAESPGEGKGSTFTITLPALK